MKKKQRKRVAKMRNGAVIEFRPERPKLLVCQSAFDHLAWDVQQALLTGEWPAWSVAPAVSVTENVVTYTVRAAEIAAEIARKR